LDQRREESSLRGARSESRAVQSKLLGLLVDAVLVRNPIEAAAEEVRGGAGRGDHVSPGLRPGDGRLLRPRAGTRHEIHDLCRVLIRAHLRAHPPMPRGELAKLERSVAEVGAVAERLGQVARAMTQEKRGGAIWLLRSRLVSLPS
jgi:hypothetical protein